jgi:hypothetical protein
MLLMDVHNRHVGDTAWVFGSGATMNYLSPTFFDGKLCVSTNMGAFDFGVTPAYAFTHHHSKFHQEAGFRPNTVFVANEFDYPSTTRWDDPPGNVIVHKPKTQENSHDQFDPFERDRPAHAHQLVFGSSSVHGAMHLAAYVGAKHIVLVGVDCGVLDGVVNFEKHRNATQRSFGTWNKHLALMRDWLLDTYGVHTYSLNPFVNLHLEGHSFGGV